MSLKLPQNGAILFLLVFILIHHIFPTACYHITKKNSQKAVHPLENGEREEDWKHPEFPWCSFLPKSPTRYVSMRCEISGNFPISKYECKAYHHCVRLVNLFF